MKKEAAKRGTGQKQSAYYAGSAHIPRSAVHLPQATLGCSPSFKEQNYDIEAFADCVCRCGGCSNTSTSSNITSASRGNPKGPEYNGIGGGEGEEM